MRESSRPTRGGKVCKCRMLPSVGQESKPVQRAWGVPGLMWALLLDLLNASQSFPHCKRCGELISGKADKRFCAEQDNAEC